ncbi:MAG: hypothetical protein L0154_20940 [Chloroflexi bacterium]|nr:hypothetical protein [Chloroflexota bacterium]
MNIVDEIKQRVKPKTVIPKPAARGDFVIKGWGERHGEEALIYQIPNHKNTHKPYEKGITVSEWHQAYQRISNGEPFTREWFNQNMPDCAKEGGCNFTTIGGIFEFLGLVLYRGNGLYEPL